MKNKKLFMCLGLGLAVFTLVLSGCNKNNASPVVEYTISFDTQGGSEISPIKVKEGDKVARPSNPTKDDYTFIDWYQEKELINAFNFDLEIYRDWTLYAGWKEADVTVTFDSCGGSYVAPITVEKGQKIKEPNAPTKDNYSFNGWYLEPEATNKFNFSNAIMSDMTLYAGWKDAEYIVTFNSMGGSEVDSVTVKSGTTIAAPDSPNKKYCNFIGWYTDSELTSLFDFSTPITSNLTLFAGWEEAETTLKLKTAVFADIQLCAKENGDGYVGNAGNTTNAYIALKNHLSLCKKENVDVILMNGDIVNNAIEEYYTLFKNTFENVYGTDTSQYPEIVYNMGNHEWWDGQEHVTEGAVSLFKKYAMTGDIVKQTSVTFHIDEEEVLPKETLPTYYRVIKGVPFLVISGEDPSGTIGDTMRSEIAGWLQEISQLESVRDGGPIYVAYHCALSTTLTHGNGSFPQSSVLENLLKDYPQAIVFTGDTHYSGVNERAINQVDFTAINIGSSSYSRMDKMSATMKNGEHFYNLDTNGSQIKDMVAGCSAYKAQYTQTIHMMETFENQNTVINRYFSTNDSNNPIHINKEWKIPRGSNKTNFKYTNARFKNTSAANELYGADGVSWPNDANVFFGVENNKMTVIFPDTNEYHYTEHYKIDVSGLATKTYDVAGNYYRYEAIRENNYFVLSNLPSGDNYTVKVTAYDYFDNPSLNYLTSSINNPDICADEIDDALTYTYCELSSRLRFDDCAPSSKSSIEFYYQGVMNRELAVNSLIYDFSNGRSASQYISIGNTEECEVIVKTKVKNISNDTLTFSLTLYDKNESYIISAPSSTRKQVAPTNEWTSLEWNLTSMFPDIVGRSGVSFVQLRVSSTGYNDEGFNMHFLLDDEDVVAGNHVDIPETPSINNLEMCNYENGQWRGTGSSAEVSFTEVYGSNSFSSRKITFANSEGLPGSTVNASFNLATTHTDGLGTENAIDAKKSILSFDIKLSEEFFNSGHANRNKFSLKIEDGKWKSASAQYLPLVNDISSFTYENTDNGWIHVEQNLSEVSAFSALSDSTYVITFGLYGITNETKDTAYAIFDNISFKEIPEGQIHVSESPSRLNLEMCSFESGQWRGTGSSETISYDELYGNNSTSSCKVSFLNSEGLPEVIDDSNKATVNASFNLATGGIGTNNGIDAKKCTLSFDIKLSEEFFNSTHSDRNKFSLKIEDGKWKTVLVHDLLLTPNLSYENTDNGWIHVEIDLSTINDFSVLNEDTYVITFGFYGITTETQQNAYVVLDNVALIQNS